MPHQPNLVDLKELCRLIDALELKDTKRNEYLNARWLKTVLAAWTFLAMNANRNDARFWAALVFVVFVAVSGVFVWWLKRDGKRLEKKLLTT